MNQWNYRLTVQTCDGANVWELRAIYYDAEGNVSAWSADPAVAFGESWQECADDLTRMASVIGDEAYDLDAKRWVDHNRHPLEAA